MSNVQRFGGLNAANPANYGAYGTAIGNALAPYPPYVLQGQYAPSVPGMLGLGNQVQSAAYPVTGDPIENVRATVALYNPVIQFIRAVRVAQFYCQKCHTWYSGKKTIISHLYAAHVMTGEPIEKDFVKKIKKL